MTQRQPCRFRRHDFGNGACMIELMRDGRTFGVIRRGSFDKPFDIGQSRRSSGPWRPPSMTILGVA